MNAPRPITSGVFRVSGHPSYLGFVLPLSGIAIGLGTATPFTAVLAFFVITSRWYIPFEENKIEETFGSEYLAYKPRTGRWAQKRPPVAPDAIPSHYTHTAPGSGERDTFCNHACDRQLASTRRFDDPKRDHH